jgi:hypothetical protein
LTLVANTVAEAPAEGKRPGKGPGALNAIPILSIFSRSACPQAGSPARTGHLTACINNQRAMKSKRVFPPAEKTPAADKTF